MLRRDPAIPAPPLRGQFTKPNFAIVFDPPAVLPKIRRFHGRSLGVTASERWARTANIDGLLLELLEPHSDTRTLGLLGVTEFPTLRSLLDTTIGSVPAAILTDATKRDRAKARRLALMSATLYFAAVMSSIPIRIAANADRWPTWATVSSMAAALSLLGAFWCQREHRRMRKRYRDGVDADAADSELRGGHLRRQ